MEYENVGHEMKVYGTRNESIWGTFIQLQVHKGKWRFEAKHKGENNK